MYLIIIIMRMTLLNIQIEARSRYLRNMARIALERKLADNSKYYHININDYGFEVSTVENVETIILSRNQSKEKL